MHRDSDYQVRRKHLEGLSEGELDKKFWELANQIVKPLVEMAHGHTSPSIERSVLLRLGFDSMSAGVLVKRVEELGLLGHGAGNVLLKLSHAMGTDIQVASEIILTEAGGAKARELFLASEESAE
jgi:D-ornithine 4,5-aminomutase subunit alpha